MKKALMDAITEAVKPPFRIFDHLNEEHLPVPGTKIRWKDEAFDCVRNAEIVEKHENGWAYWVTEGRGKFLINECHVVAVEEDTDMGSNRRENAPRAEPAKKAVTADAVIAAYIKTRDAIDEEKRIYEEKVEKLKAVQAKREQWLTSELDKLKLTSFKKTGVGIAFFKTRTSATMADATEFVKWVKEDWDGRNHFLEKRVSKTAVDEAVKDGETPPPGTNYSSTRVVQINRG